jgi:hypothetical protein
LIVATSIGSPATTWPSSTINLISTGDVQGAPLVEMELADFERPIHNAMRSTSVTACAAAAT